MSPVASDSATGAAPSTEQTAGEERPYLFVTASVSKPMIGDGNREQHRAFLQDLHSDPLLAPAFAGCGGGTDIDFMLEEWTETTYQDIRNAMLALRDRHPAILLEVTFSSWVAAA